VSGLLVHITVSAIPTIRVELHGGGTSVTEWLVAGAAVASAVVALCVSIWATSRTISNDRTERKLDRNADWREQVHDRQLNASADFAQAAFGALVVLNMIRPPAGRADGPPSEELARSRLLVDAARRGLARVQMLFREGAEVEVPKCANTVVTELTRAQQELEERASAKDPIRRAKAEAEYMSQLNEAEKHYYDFVARAGGVVSTPPE
jgi:hypothetical protein